jgi:hypothetical protein
LLPRQPNGGRLFFSLDLALLVWDMTRLTAHGRLIPVTLSENKLEALWADLSGDSPPAYRAIWTLAAGGKQAVALLKKRLQPVPPDNTRKLLHELDARRYATRKEAMRRLELQGQWIEAELRQALQGKVSAEVRRQVGVLLKKVEEEKRNLSVQQLRVLRALEVLEHIGTAEARQLLKTLAGGVLQTRLTQEAQAAFERLTTRANARQ